MHFFGLSSRNAVAQPAFVQDQSLNAEAMRRLDDEQKEKEQMQQRLHDATSRLHVLEWKASVARRQHEEGVK